MLRPPPAFGSTGQGRPTPYSHTTAALPSLPCRYSQDRVALDASAAAGLHRQYEAAGLGPAAAEVAADPLQQLWFQVWRAAAEPRFRGLAQAGRRLLHLSCN